MNALLFAAGLGTRLLPLTAHQPKALVPLAGQPMIDYTLAKLRRDGFDNIVVNAHHFAPQIVAYLRGTGVTVSVEEELLDTGGGLRRAMPLFGNDDPILVHNVDILSSAALGEFYRAASPTAVTLLVSPRQATRYLLFDDDMLMVGWTDERTGELRTPYPSLNVAACRRYAFAGIHVVPPTLAPLLATEGARFAIIDFYLRHCRTFTIRGVVDAALRMIDVGKVDSLRQAEAYLTQRNKIK